MIGHDLCLPKAMFCREQPLYDFTSPGPDQDLFMDDVQRDSVDLKRGLNLTTDIASRSSTSWGSPPRYGRTPKMPGQRNGGMVVSAAV